MARRTRFWDGDWWTVIAFRKPPDRFEFNAERGGRLWYRKIEGQAAARAVGLALSAEGIRGVIRKGPRLPPRGERRMLAGAGGKQDSWRTVIVYGDEPRDYPFRPAIGRSGVWYQEIAVPEVAENLARMLAAEGMHGVIKRGRPRDLGLTG